MAGAADLTDAIEHLRAADPVLRDLIDRIGVDSLGNRRVARSRDHYGALVRTIVGQQLSTRAARAIYDRLTARFGGRAPTPEEILADDPDELRASAGLSHAKVRYLRSLAEHVLDGSLELGKLGRLSDEEVTARLDGHQRDRPMERRHVPDVPPPAPGRVAGRRPGHPQGV